MLNYKMVIVILSSNDNAIFAYKAKSNRLRTVSLVTQDWVENPNKNILIRMI